MLDPRPKCYEFPVSELLSDPEFGAELIYKCAKRVGWPRA